jgi:uncharacterized protein
MNVIRDRKIDYIEFHSTDIEATKAFYQKVFGWSFEDYGPEYTSFSDGRIAGGFQKAAQAGSSGALIVIFVEDLQATEQNVKSAGDGLQRNAFLSLVVRAFTFVILAGTNSLPGTRRNAHPEERLAIGEPFFSAGMVSYAGMPGATVCGRVSRWTKW